MKYILWQEGYNRLHVGVSLPCKLHIPEPIHTPPPTPLLAFRLPGFPLPAPPRRLAPRFSSVLWAFLFGDSSPRLFFKRSFGVWWTAFWPLTSFLAASLLHPLLVLPPPHSQAATSSPRLCSTNVFWNVPLLFFIQKFSQDLPLSETNSQNV